jgi:putative FmdB family regulatory protein
MPIYEFRCGACRRQTNALVMNRDRTGEVRCRHCGSDRLERLVSRFATPRGDDARMEALAESASASAEGVDQNDPKSAATFMKKMSRDMGDEFGSELDQAMDETLASDAGADSDDDAGGL